MLRKPMGTKVGPLRHGRPGRGGETPQPGKNQEWVKVTQRDQHGSPWLPLTTDGGTRHDFDLGTTTG